MENLERRRYITAFSCAALDSSVLRQTRRIPSITGCSVGGQVDALARRVGSRFECATPYVERTKLRPLAFYCHDHYRQANPKRKELARPSFTYNQFHKATPIVATHQFLQVPYRSFQRFTFETSTHLPRHHHVHSPPFNTRRAPRRSNPPGSIPSRQGSNPHPLPRVRAIPPRLCRR